MLYEICTMITSQEIDLQLFKIGTNLQTVSQTGNNFLDASYSILGLGNRSICRTISKIVKSNLPILELSRVTGA